MCERVAWVGYGYGLGVQRRDGLCSQRWICLRAWETLGLLDYWTEELNNLGPTVQGHLQSWRPWRRQIQHRKATYDGPRVRAPWNLGRLAA